MVGDVREIELIQQQVRRLQLGVVTDDAVLIDEGTLLGNVGSRCGGRGRGRHLCTLHGRCGWGGRAWRRGLRRRRLAGHEDH